MDAIQPHGNPLALEPIEMSTADNGAAHTADGGSSAGATRPRELHITTADEFLASAAKEFQEGHIDPDLWARASVQSGNDKSLVVAAYLRARATALQLERRNKRLERRASRAGSRQDANRRKVESEPQSEMLPVEAAGVRLMGVQAKPGYVAAAAAALAFVVGAVWLIALPQENESVVPQRVSTAATAKSSAASTGQGGNAERVAAGASGVARQDDLVPSVEAMVQQLKDAGNWNVHVLYASKWTRDEPNNAAAWNELSIGYANLRQISDAAAAAKRAVELAPDDTRLWRNLGHLNLSLDRLPEAGSAFERVLAVNSEDADALCGAASVAHRLGRTKDADAITKRVRSADGNCPDMNDGESVAVAAGLVEARKPKSSVGR